MREDELKKLLNELSDATAEQVRGGLAEEIKQQIPERLVPHRRGMDTINIIIDLRVSKLAAAAVIIITMILLAHLFGGRDLTSGRIYQDGKLLARYLLGGESASRSDVLVGMSKFYEHLVQQGMDVAYYGDSIDPEDSNAVLMQWKLSAECCDGMYRVIFGDLREETVSAEELIKLQSRMLQKKAK